MDQPAFELRPLTVSEIIDRSFFLYRRRFLDLVAVSAATYLPLLLVSGVAAWHIWTQVASFLHSQQMPMASLVRVAGYGAVVAVLWMLGAALVYAALAVYISEYYIGGRAGVRDAYRPVVSALPSLLAAWVLVFILVTLGMLLLIIPGIWLAVACTFAWPIVAIERRGPIAAISRSIYLVQGHWWRVFATLLLFQLLIAMLRAALTYPLTIPLALGLVNVSPVAAQVASQLVGYAVHIAVVPLAIIALVLLYYDLRVRKEGLDLELLARQMGAKAEPPPEAGELFVTDELPPPPGGEA